MKTKVRDPYYDILKGLLIIIVVFGHIFQNQTDEYTNGGILSNIIWAIQMPGFFFISGYFGRKAIEFNMVVPTVFKKCQAYLLPLFSWYLLVEVLLLGHCEHNVFSALITFYKRIDGTFWFLWVVFILSVIFTGVNCLLKKNKLTDYIISILFLGVVYGGLLGFGVAVGMNTLGIKLILYYAVFYALGYLWKLALELNLKILDLIKNIAFIISVFCFFFIIVNFDLYNNSDGLYNIGLRVIASISGVYILLYIVKRYQVILEKTKLSFLGKYTLEIYCTHMLLHHLMNTNNDSSFYTVTGFLNFLFGLVLCCIFTFFVIAILKSNKVTNFIFYGKKN